MQLYLFIMPDGSQTYSYTDSNIHSHIEIKKNTAEMLLFAS